jgi:hypothetical protein
LSLVEQGSLFSWITLDDVSDWGLSTKGNSGKCIHDQVDPKEHLSSHRWLREDEDTNKDSEDQTDVHGQLELKETSAVQEKVSTPLDSGSDT